MRPARPASDLDHSLPQSEAKCKTWDEGCVPQNVSASMAAAAAKAAGADGAGVDVGPLPAGVPVRLTVLLPLTLAQFNATVRRVRATDRQTN